MSENSVKKGIGLGIGGCIGIIIVIIAIIMLGSAGSSSNSSSTSTSKNADSTTSDTKTGSVIVKSHTLKDEGYGMRSIVGEVENNGNTSATFVQITATFYDSKGSVTGTEFTYAGDTGSSPLEKTKTAPFKVIIMDSKTVIDDYKLDVSWN